MENKIEVIDNSKEQVVFGKNKKQKEPFYHLIAEQPNGQKIAFGVDNGGK